MIKNYIIILFFLLFTTNSFSAGSSSSDDSSKVKSNYDKAVVLIKSAKKLEKRKNRES
jgi:hypothetical protein